MVFCSLISYRIYYELDNVLRYLNFIQFVNSFVSLFRQPQHAIPDIFLWLVSNGKRTAYIRIPARELIYSPVPEECGRHCGKVQTLFLKVIHLICTKAVLNRLKKKSHLTFTKIFKNTWLKLAQY